MNRIDEGLDRIIELLELLALAFPDSSKTIRRIIEFVLAIKALIQPLQTLLNDINEGWGLAGTLMNLLKSENDEYILKNTQLETQVTSLEADKDQLEKNNVELNARIQDLESENRSLRDMVQTLTEQKDTLANELEDANITIGQLQTENTLLTQEVERLNGEITPLINHVVQADSIIKGMLSMVDIDDTLGTLYRYRFTDAGFTYYSPVRSSLNKVAPSPDLIETMTGSLSFPRPENERLYIDSGLERIYLCVEGNTTTKPTRSTLMSYYMTYLR